MPERARDGSCGPPLKARARPDAWERLSQAVLMQLERHPHDFLIGLDELVSDREADLEGLFLLM